MSRTTVAISAMRLGTALLLISPGVALPHSHGLLVPTQDDVEALAADANPELAAPVGAAMSGEDGVECEAISKASVVEAAPPSEYFITLPAAAE